MIEQPAGDADSLKAQAEIIVWWQKQCAALTKERDALRETREMRLEAAEKERDAAHNALAAKHGGEPIALLKELDEVRVELAAFKKQHAECLPRVCVEDLLDSTLPCGHPDRCGYSHDKEGRKLGCRWCDDKRNARVEIDRLREALVDIFTSHGQQSNPEIERICQKAGKALAPQPQAGGK